MSQPSLDAGVDLDLAVGQSEPVAPCTMFSGQNRAQRNGGMTAEGNLAFGRKVACGPKIALWMSKGGLGVSDFGSDALHHVCPERFVGQDHTCGIPAAPGLCECCNSMYLHRTCLFFGMFFN